VFPATCQSGLGENKPKLLEALENSIFYNAPPPYELGRYAYRKAFGLSSSEMDNEPYEEYVVNIHIMALLADKEKLDLERRKNGK